MSEALAEADRRIENIVRVGRVASVDPGSATAIVDFGSFQSPPLPVGQLSAGAIQFWWMPSIGEQVLVACEGGDVGQGVIVASLSARTSPSGSSMVGICTPSVSMLSATTSSMLDIRSTPSCMRW